MENADGWVQVGLAVVSIFLTLWLVRRERRSRSLSFAILSNRSIITTHSKFPLQVTFDGIPLAKPHLLVWRLVNTGAQPIQPADYEEDIALNVEGATIVSADVTTTRPNSLRPQLSHTRGDRVELDRRLLNPGDLIEVQMLVDGSPAGINATCRIAGVRQVELARLPQTSPDQPWKFSKFDTTLAMTPFLLLSLAAFVLIFGTDLIAAKLIGSAVAGFALFVYPALIWRATRKNRLFLGT